MKISAIDIGSNSVRLALVSDGKTLYKLLKTTRLGEGLSFSGILKAEAIERTAQAVADFVNRAKAEKTDRLYAFATAAVRSASNKAQFLMRVKELCGLEIDVIGGEQEAQIGILGALGNNDGGIIDVGGASTEVTFRAGGKTVYSKSVNVGTVRLFDLAARDKQKLLRIISEKIEEYGEFSAENINVSAIGGTATRLAAIKHNLLQYTPEVTDGTRFTVAELEKYADALLSTPVEIIRANTICTASAEVISGGCLLLSAVMKKFDISEISVSESDNLEGYIIYKEGAL